MLATPVMQLPAGPGWAYEMKWDGYRALATWDGTRLTLASRTGRDLLPEFPELRPLATALGRPAIVDGEVVALGDDGRPSFNLLQNRQRRRRPHIVFMAFDAVYAAGRSLLRSPYEARRVALENFRLDGSHWLTPPFQVGDADLAQHAARDHHLEGVVAKRLDSAYVPGPKRTDAWQKHKFVLREEFVVGGYLPGSAGFNGLMGALLLGYYAPTAPRGQMELHYAGKVGKGWMSVLDRGEFRRALDRIKIDRSPFVTTPPFPVPPTFCEPRIVIEVEFTEWTPDGLLRHATYRGIRTDRRPRDVVDPRPRRN